MNDTSPDGAAPAAAFAAPDALGCLRARVLNDTVLQARLAPIADPGAFVEAAVEVADTYGIDLSGLDVQASLRGYHTGPERLMRTPPIRPWAPHPGWLPVELSQDGDRLGVEWAYFGDRRLSESFYQGEIFRALQQPFNRVFRVRTPLEDLVAWPASLPTLAPTGFIFHMSRCGSTLAAQMLARSPSNIVVSEAAPIDNIVRIVRATPDWSQDQHVGLIRAMVSAFGQVRNPDERRYFLKLDCWHTLSLRLFRKAFPDTPWVFLYRDPVEVMVSQSRRAGVQMVPQFMPPELYGLDLPDGVADDGYRADVLNAVCEGALRGYAEGDGLLVNYAALPDALFTAILPHFGVDCPPDERAIMAGAARFDAKAPQMDFTADSESKRREASESIRAACARGLDATYRRLEALRAREITRPAAAPPSGRSP